MRVEIDQRARFVELENAAQRVVVERCHFPIGADAGVVEALLVDCPHTCDRQIDPAAAATTSGTMRACTARLA
jgi:hypothetical protein